MGSVRPYPNKSGREQEEKVSSALYTSTQQPTVKPSTWARAHEPKHLVKLETGLPSVQRSTHQARQGYKARHHQ